MSDTLQQRLTAALHQPITRLCPNRFHDAQANHCAHFVSHMAGFDFSFTCRDHRGGNAPGANLRVHEIFARCPEVGLWAERPKDAVPLLVFVTRRDNVDLTRRQMANVPQKHVGIHLDGTIYHYANGAGRVQACTAAQFLATFRRSYTGPQALFFGRFPGAEQHVAVQRKAADVARGKAFELRKEGQRWFAQESGGAAFLVGRETANGAQTGLFMAPTDAYGPVYAASEHVARHGHWANLLELSGHCESGNRFNMVNTYDTAKFTFGFVQMAAHTPDENLIRFFHRLSALPGFADYFPDLLMQGGRLHRRDGSGRLSNLELISPTGPNRRRQIQPFMDYLNPKSAAPDPQEVLQAARLVHWANTSAQMRTLQVTQASETLQQKLGSVYARWYDLDGRADTLCALVADIHHQGRASRAKVAAALASPDAQERLITIHPGYTGRIAALRRKIGRMQAEGRLGRLRYAAGENAFR